jgi:hypothetical protein
LTSSARFTSLASYPVTLPQIVSDAKVAACLFLDRVVGPRASTPAESEHEEFFRLYLRYLRAARSVQLSEESIVARSELAMAMEIGMTGIKAVWNIY